MLRSKVDLTGVEIQGIWLGLPNYDEATGNYTWDHPGFPEAEILPAPELPVVEAAPAEPVDVVDAPVVTETTITVVEPGIVVVEEPPVEVDLSKSTLNDEGNIVFQKEVDEVETKDWIVVVDAPTVEVGVEVTTEPEAVRLEEVPVENVPEKEQIAEPITSTELVPVESVGPLPKK